MKRLLFAILTFSAFALFMACSGENEPATAQQNAPEKAVDTASVQFTWYTDWNEGMAAAKKEKKPVIVDFYADWCRYCKQLDAETFSAPEVKSRLAQSWIGIKINGEDTNAKATFDGKTYSPPELMRYFGIRGFPTLLFFDNKGNPVKPYTVYINFVPKKPFGPLLDYFRDELYSKNIDINNYIKSKN